MKYDWYDGIWLTDGHNWNLDFDIPRLPREDTGETVVLQPPKFMQYEVPPVECKIYYVPKTNIYIAMGENAFRHIPVLFYDKNSFTAEFQRKYPERILDWGKSMNDLNKLIEEAKSVIGPGWWPIIEKYLPQIVELAPDCDIIVKEKFGLLRIRCLGQVADRKTINKLQDEAYVASSTVCEECGAPGKHRPDLDWQQTLCEPCYQKAHEKEWKAWYDAGESIEEKVESLRRYLGDMYAVYANVCNRIDPAQPDEELLAIQRYVEHLITLDVMEEYSWEKTEDGKWRYVTSEEFFARLRAAKGLPPKRE